MGLPVYYQWDDVGAPVINGVVGSFKTAMKTLLVGTAGIAYGSKPAAGWTVEYESGNKIVFRNSLASGGSGCYLRINDANATYAEWRFYESMSDIDTGVGASGNVRVYKSTAAGSTTRPWSIMADDRTIYGTVFQDSTAVPDFSAMFIDYSSTFAGGDYLPFNAADPGVFCVGRLNGDAYKDAPLCAMQQYTPSATYITSTRNNSATRAATQIRPQFYHNSYGNWYIGTTAGYPFPAIGTTGSFFYPAIFGAGFVDINSYALRGRFRGMWYPHCDLTATVAALGDTVTPVGAAGIGALRMFCVGCNDTQYGGYFGLQQGAW